MKKSLIILFAAALLAACTSTEKMDSQAGASLNKMDTVAKYEALSSKVDAIASNPDATPEEFAAAQAEVKEFMKYLESYKDSATPSAQGYIDEYTGSLGESYIFRDNRND
jgi:outer membrane murein-binding lipoprotein Lpp